MKVLFVSPSFYPAFHYGGPIFINRSFCQALAQNADVDVTVLTTDANGPDNRLDVNSALADTQALYGIRYCRRVFLPDIAPGLLLRLGGTIRAADVVHLNGVYSFTTIPTIVLCRLMNKPLVWSTMGALQRWEGSTRQRMKSVWEHVCNLFADPKRLLMHVTSEEERIESLEKIPRAGALVLRNGIEIPEARTFAPRAAADKLQLLYIGRLHPIKGIENLLRALTKVNSQVELAICGAGELSYENRLREMVNELQLSPIVHFHGRVDGEEKERQFQQADLCIAPSFKEAFCTVVLESLVRSVPVIASHGVPWEKIEEHGCGLWVSNDPEQLAAAIDRAAAMPLREMGNRGRAWMTAEYSWEQVAAEMIAEYQRMTGQMTTGDVPVQRLAKTA